MKIDRNTVTLELPDMKLFPSYIEALREGFYRGIMAVKSEEEIQEIEKDPASHIQELNAPSTGTVTTPDGTEFDKVPDETLWLVCDDVFIGEVSFRHKLNEPLENFGGHVGYGIRPSLEGQGFGTLALKLTKERAAKMGMDKLLVTCDPDHAASEKIILRHWMI